MIFQHHHANHHLFQNLLRVYPIKIMGDINDADYFLSVLHILSGRPIHNYYWSLKSQHYDNMDKSIFLWCSVHLIGIWTPCHFDW